VVAVRWDSEVLEYLVLSDSVLLLERTTGEVTAVLDTRLDRLPSRVLEMRTAVRALPSGSAEGAEADRWYARAVEECRNAEGGFFTAAADPDVAGLAMTGTVPLVDVVSFAALTDGMTRWVENFELGRWPELLAVLREGGTKELFRQVRAAEVADPEALWYHKVHDDATAVFVEL
jgi:hypothetical protein